MKGFQPNTLIIEDDPLIAEQISKLLTHSHIFVVSESQPAVSLLKKYPIDIAFVDLTLPNSSGHEVIKEIKLFDPSIEVIVISSTTKISDAIRAFRMGISDFLQKPLPSNHILDAFDKGCKRRLAFIKSRQLVEQQKTQKKCIIIGDAAPTREIKKQIDQLKTSNIDVLIVGESGTGKELVAKSLFQTRQDENRPYITVNCSSIPENLIESVLFGHEKGAFTGAIRQQIGKFELAHGGDIFLDEIGTLPLHLQAKLLRVLQEREIEPVGLGHAKTLNFRVIAATNENLPECIAAQTFRKDLYYRLNKFVICLPPLRARTQDIPILAEHFLTKHARNRIKKQISKSALEKLSTYHWPGNIRELENVLENLSITTEGPMINEAQIIRFFHHHHEGATPIATQAEIGDSKSLQVKLDPNATLAQAICFTETQMIRNSLEQTKSKQAAAQKLGIDRRTLYRKMQDLGI